MNAPDCSICLEVVINNNIRSIAKLKCGHLFHLDCIGSAFNVKGLMCCPNCRDIENGNWLFLEAEEPYAQYYEEEDETIVPDPIVEEHFGPTVEVEAHIPGTIGPIVAADVNEPNLELTLALRNGPPLSPARNVPLPRPNEQPAGTHDLELSLALNSTYGQQSSSSQIWVEDMMIVDDIPNEEDDDDIKHPNMIQFL